MRYVTILFKFVDPFFFNKNARFIPEATGINRAFVYIFFGIYPVILQLATFSRLCIPAFPCLKLSDNYAR